MISRGRLQVPEAARPASYSRPGCPAPRFHLSPEDPDDEVLELLPQYSEEDRTRWKLRSTSKALPLVRVTAASEGLSHDQLVCTHKEPSLMRRIFTHAVSNANILNTQKLDKTALYTVVFPAGYQDVRLHAKKWHNVGKLPEYHTRLGKAKTTSRYTFEPFVLLRKVTASVSAPGSEEWEAQNRLDLETAAEHRARVRFQISEVISGVVRLIAFCETSINFFEQELMFHPDPNSNDTMIIRDYVQQCNGFKGLACAEFVLGRWTDFVAFVGRHEDHTEFTAQLKEIVRKLRVKVRAVSAYEKVL